MTMWPPMVMSHCGPGVGHLQDAQRSMRVTSRRNQKVERVLIMNW
jgi:hypothetical protein